MDSSNCPSFSQNKSPERGHGLDYGSKWACATKPPLVLRHTHVFHAGSLATQAVMQTCRPPDSQAGMKSPFLFHHFALDFTSAVTRSSPRQRPTVPPPASRRSNKTPAGPLELSFNSGARLEKFPLGRGRGRGNNEAAVSCEELPARNTPATSAFGPVKASGSPKPHGTEEGEQKQHVPGEPGRTDPNQHILHASAETSGNSVNRRFKKNKNKKKRHKRAIISNLWTQNKEPVPPHACTATCTNI